ncbi:MAG: hypothetical protein R3308_02750 [Thiohalobacterales bacterium]|nr:hypothetical protein [Thiohalobacterales bacterium]
MEEQEYKNTYKAVNERRCVFEKTINSRRGTCERSRRFHLADREGIACTSASGNALCTDMLERLRAKARFALHQTSTGGPLPHNREVKVQTGGMLGLQALLHPERAGATNIDNIIAVIERALEEFGDFDELPYEDIVKAIVSFEGRRRRSHRNKPG